MYKWFRGCVEKVQEMTNDEDSLIKRIIKTTIITLIVIGLLVLIIVIVGLQKSFNPPPVSNFNNYESFQQTLEKRNSYGAECFREKLPESADEINCYWDRSPGIKSATYSMTLKKSDYQTMKEDRVLHYQSVSPNCTIYLFSEGDKYFIGDSELYYSTLFFIDSVLQDEKKKDQYYFLIINKMNSNEEECYNGIVVNDETREVIEFCTQIETYGY